MTDAFTDCYNCGRSNPEWAQVCRSCGVQLRHRDDAVAPSGRFPTDRTSLTSIGAVVGTILVAALLGFFISTLNPVDPTVGLNVATPTPSPSVEASPSATEIPTLTPIPTPTATPGPPGTLAFGTGLEGDQVTNPTDTFTPGTTFAHSITLPEPFGVNSVGEQLARVAADGSEEEVQRPVDAQVQVVPEATSAGFDVPADLLFDAYGPGQYVMRVYAGTVLLAEGRFTLAEG